MKIKPIISALPALTPVSIVETKTGLTLSVQQHDSIMTKLITFVQTSAEKCYKENKTQLEKDILDSSRIFNPAEFARAHGYSLDANNVPKEIVAKSRVERLFRHKLVSEVAGYVMNDNPRKQAMNFGATINVGATDKQFASMSMEGNRLFLLIKPWDKELLLEFAIPDYITSRRIKKWSLPVVNLNKNGITYRFAVTEDPHVIVKPSNHRAGVDLGRTQPYVVAITNEAGARVAHYLAPGRVTALNSKRESLIKEKKHTLLRAKAKSKLGLESDAETLFRESAYLTNKIRVLGGEVAAQVAASLAKQLEKHKINTLAVEDLRWVTGAKYGSRWAHSRTQASITHALARKGTLTKRVNPKNTSSTCHRCLLPVTNSVNRTVLCRNCRIKHDRDYNAAINISNKLTPRRPEKKRTIGGNCRLPQQVIEGSNPHGSDSEHLIAILVT